MNCLSRDEGRGIDRCAIQTMGVPGVVLMENAGRNAADAIEEFLAGAAGPDLPRRGPPRRGSTRASQSSIRIAVIAGPGNNGGDGFVIARHLAMRGAEVVTFLVAPQEKIAGDAAVNLNVIRKLGHDIRCVSPADLEDLSRSLRGFDLLIDAVGGTGIRGALRGPAAEAVRQINAAGRPVVAVDIPTGLDCDTGEAAGPAIRAAMTVTFLARKKGFDAPGSSEYTGQVRVVDIGIPADLVQDISRRQAT